MKLWLRATFLDGPGAGKNRSDQIIHSTIMWLGKPQQLDTNDDQVSRQQMATGLENSMHVTSSVIKGSDDSIIIALNLTVVNLAVEEQIRLLSSGGSFTGRHFLFRATSSYDVWPTHAAKRMVPSTITDRPQDRARCGM